MNSKKDELKINQKRIVDILNTFMYKKNWSIKQLSEHADLPYESVKKILAGKINNPTIYSLTKLCHALDCSLDYLMDTSSDTDIELHNFPPRVTTLLNEIIQFEIHLKKRNILSNTNLISTLVPTGTIKDGILFDSITLDSVDISEYVNDIGNIAMCGIKILGNELSPTYINDDVLLIARDRFPLDGEIGIFVIGNKAYIRKYTFGTPMQLTSLNDNTQSIIIKNIDDVHFFGRVLTIVRK